MRTTIYEYTKRFGLNNVIIICCTSNLGNSLRCATSDDILQVRNVLLFLNHGMHKVF